MRLPLDGTLHLWLLQIKAVACETFFVRLFIHLTKQDSDDDRFKQDFPPPGVDRCGWSGRGSHGCDDHGWHIDARAGSESPQKAVKYQDTPKGEQRCENCALFEPPSSYKTVDGTVSPEGWCTVYAKKQV